MGQQFAQQNPVHQPPVITLSQQEELIEKALALQKESYDQAATYSKAIIGLGFAGFFTIWSTTRDLLGPHQKVAAALLLAFALFCYIAFEVAQMVYLARMRFLLANNIAKKHLQAFDQHTKQAQRHAPIWGRLWYITLCLTVIPGFLGGGVLIYAFIWRLFH